MHRTAALHDYVSRRKIGGHVKIIFSGLDKHVAICVKSAMCHGVFSVPVFRLTQIKLLPYKKIIYRNPLASSILKHFWSSPCHRTTLAGSGFTARSKSEFNRRAYWHALQHAYHEKGWIWRLVYSVVEGGGLFKTAFPTRGFQLSHLTHFESRFEGVFLIARQNFFDFLLRSL